MLERLQKIIARAGIASRRHAEELIRSGQVRVNGVVVTELGAKADPEYDRVEAAGRLAEQPAEPGYYLLHKPVHVVSTMSDPEGRATLRHVLRGLSGGVFPVGRLDYAISGALLLTTDGQLADRILKNSSRLPKVYWLKVAGRLSDDELQQISRRAHAHLRRLRAPGAAASHGSNPWYEVELTDARSDVLRSALFEIDHPVEKMKRVKLGPLELGSLPEGHYRQLAPSEVAQLRRMVEQASSNAPAQKEGLAPAGERKRTAPAWKPRRPAPAWQTNSAARADETKSGAPEWQNHSAAGAEQNYSATGAEQSKTGASAGQPRTPATPWQTTSAPGAGQSAGQKKTGGNPWQKKSARGAWQNKRSAGQNTGGAPAWRGKNRGAGQTRSAAPPWKTKSGGNAGGPRSGPPPWKNAPSWKKKGGAPAWQSHSAAGAEQNKTGGSSGQKRSGARPWQNRSAAGAGQKKTGASAWQKRRQNKTGANTWRPKGSAPAEHRRGNPRPHSPNREDRQSYGGRGRHPGHDARKGRGGRHRNEQNPRHPAP